MSSTGATLSAAPPKPWEQASGTNNSIPFMPIAPYSSFPSPPSLPSPPLPPLSPSAWPETAAAETSATMPGGYQRPFANTYFQPQSYRGYNGYGAPAPGSYLMSSVESRARPFFDSLNLMLNALNQVAAVVDSASYAVWASAAAFGALGGTLKSLRSVYWQKLLKLISAALAEIRRPGRRQVALIAALLGAVWAFREAFRALQDVSSASECDVPPASENTTNEDFVFVKAMYPFAAVEPRLHLGFDTEDILLISRQNCSKLHDQNGLWIMARSKEGKTGYVPSNYLRAIP